MHPDQAPADVVTDDKSSNGKAVKPVHPDQAESTFNTLVVLIKGNDVSPVQPEKEFDSVVALEVSSRGTEVKFVHSRQNLKKLVTLLVSSIEKLVSLVFEEKAEFKVVRDEPPVMVAVNIVSVKFLNWVGLLLLVTLISPVGTTLAEKPAE